MNLLYKKTIFCSFSLLFLAAFSFIFKFIRSPRKLAATGTKQTFFAWNLFFGRRKIVDVNILCTHQISSVFLFCFEKKNDANCYIYYEISPANAWTVYKAKCNCTFFLAFFLFLFFLFGFFAYTSNLLYHKTRFIYLLYHMHALVRTYYLENRMEFRRFSHTKNYHKYKTKQLMLRNVCFSDLPYISLKKNHQIDLLEVIYLPFR